MTCASQYNTVYTQHENILLIYQNVSKHCQIDFIHIIKYIYINLSTANICKKRKIWSTMALRQLFFDIFYYKYFKNIFFSKHYFLLCKKVGIRWRDAWKGPGYYLYSAIQELSVISAQCGFTDCCTTLPNFRLFRDRRQKLFETYFVMIFMGKEENVLSNAHIDALLYTETNLWNIYINIFWHWNLDHIWFYSNKGELGLSTRLRIYNIYAQIKIRGHALKSTLTFVWLLWRALWVIDQMSEMVK